MGMKTKMKTDTWKAAERIVQVLHDEEIPFSLFDDTFQHTKELAMRYTTPYSPNELKIIRLAASANVDSDTDSKQL